MTRSRTLSATIFAASAAMVLAITTGCTAMTVDSSNTAALCDTGTCTQARVERVIDGDTLDVRTDTGDTERVRILGIDTPETVDPDEPVACMGPEASAIANELLPKKSAITLVTDPLADDHDHYGRVLAHVLASNDANVAEELLTMGLAETTSFKHSLTSDYAADQDQARHAGAGLWSAC